jgi:Condensation domain/Phosphopantetheine attachment site
MRFPASFSQQRLWFLDQLEPGEPTYNMPFAVWLDGPLDPGALQRALDAMVARHAVLRTSIVAFDGMPEQVVADTGTVPIERVELPADPGDGERTRRAESIAADLARQPFDLAAGPLARATLIGAGPDRHLFVLAMHHVISDGVSMEILIPELSAAYRAETTGVPASLPPLWMEYGDYSVWQHDRMRGEELDRQLDYWREQLRGAPQLLTLPADRPRPTEQSSRGAVAEITVDAETTRRLAAVAHDANATMFMVFLTGFVATLSRYARQADMLLGTQVTDRTHAELDPLIGMFTNILALRISLADDPTFADLLGRVRDTTVEGLAHKQLPFEKLVAELAPDRTLAYAPLIQVQFDYGSRTPPTLDLPGITTRSLALVTSTAKLDLAVHADADADADAQDSPDSPAAQFTRLSMEYSAGLFDAAWADQFLGCMATLLEHAADAPGTPVADLPMLTAAQRDELIIERNHQAPPADDGADTGDAHSAPDDSDAAGRVEPRNPVEATLAQIWGDLLDTQAPVGVHDNLFALGGHSLTATRFVARLGDAYGVELPVHQVFVGPTIAELAEVIAAHPDFRVTKGSSRHAELDALSDDDLDALLRAALAQRNRRRAIADAFDS